MISREKKCRFCNNNARFVRVFTCDFISVWRNPHDENTLPKQIMVCDSCRVGGVLIDRNRRVTFYYGIPFNEL